MAQFDDVEAMALNGRIETLAARLDAQVAARDELARRLSDAITSRLTQEATLREVKNREFEKILEAMETSHREQHNLIAANSSARAAVLARAVETLAAHQVEVADLYKAAHEREHVLTENAINKAAQALEIRLNEMNKFRQALIDQTSTFARSDLMTAQIGSLRTEINTFSEAARTQREASQETLMARINKIELWQSRADGRDAAFAIGLVVLIFVVNFVSRFIK